MIDINHSVKTLETSSLQKTVKVLVVAENNEDYTFIKVLINESLYNHQYKVEWINNYPEAINAMLKKHHDLYLVDYKLGNYTGIALLHEAICSNCTDPIIMLSAKTDAQADREALRIGATGYLVKENIDGHTLERSMRYALQQSIALKNLKKNENKFRVLFERAKYPVIITDHSGKLYDANPAAVKFFELPLEKLLATNDNVFYPINGDRDRFVQAMEDNGSVTDMEQTLRLPSGEVKFCNISSFVQISQHATSILYYSIITDQTAKKKHEAQIAEKVAISEHIVKNLATEIQDPLSNVNLALLELTTNLNGKNECLKVYVDIVKENLDRIDHLTKSVFMSVNTADSKSAE